MQGAGDIETLLADKRIGALLIGPGLIPGPDSLALLERCLAADHPPVLDAGAISLLAELGADALRGRTEPAILTPHPGEFARLFGTLPGDKVAQAREAARLSGAIIISKGADSVVAAPTAGRRFRRTRATGSRPRARATSSPARSRRCARAGLRGSRRPAPASGCTAAPPRSPGRA